MIRGPRTTSRLVRGRDGRVYRDVIAAAIEAARRLDGLTAARPAYAPPVTLIMGQLSTVPVIVRVSVPALARPVIWVSEPRATALAGSFQVTATSCHKGV